MATVEKEMRCYLHMEKIITTKRNKVTQFEIVWREVLFAQRI